MNERLLAITEKISEHLHHVVREFQVNEQELMQALNFLNEVGEKGHFHLFSDVLGVSVIVDEITHQSTGTTENNVEGPLYRRGAPVLPTPADLCPGYQEGETLVIYGQVISVEGEPVAHATLDIWQANENGVYENEDPNQPDYNLRRKIICDAQGNYEVKTIKPAGYEIGQTSPVGSLLQAIGRHSRRPGHIHFKVEANGYKTLTTQLYTPDDPYIESDIIGAVKSSLVLPLEICDDPNEMANRNSSRPFFTAKFDFIIEQVKVASNLP